MTENIAPAQPAAMSVSPPPLVLPAADVISPAEAKFWQEWADKMPALVRDNEQIMIGLKAEMTPYKTAMVAVGAALGVATFTKYVKGNWKWATGLSAVGAFASAAHSSYIQSGIKERIQSNLGYAEMLERDPRMREQLAQFLSTHVTADKIQRYGIEDAVVREGFMFQFEHRHYFNQQSAGNSISR